MNKPIQYKKGWVEFFKLKFKVTTDVLIPRPESELLVDQVLGVIASEAKQSPTVLDVGTGSGNIAISVAKNSPARIIATDISTKALKVARQNAKFHGVEDKIQFIKSDLVHFLVRSHFLLHKPLIIVTNLPYIPSERIPYLDPSVKDWEPRVALDGGEDGFNLYRQLFSQIKKLHLHPTHLIAEIDYTQGELAPLEALKYFPQASAEVKLDLAQRQRILLISF